MKAMQKTTRKVVVKSASMKKKKAVGSSASSMKKRLVSTALKEAAAEETVPTAMKKEISLDKWKKKLSPDNRQSGTFLANLAKKSSELKKHQHDCKVYASLPDSIKRSPALKRQLIAHKISTRGTYLRHLPDSMRSDPELARMAVKDDGMALQYVKGAPKQDRELVLAAVSKNASALRLAPKKFRSDRDIVKAALEFGRFGSCPLLYADKKFRKDEELVKLACLKRTDDKFFYYIDQALARREDIIKLAYNVGRNDHALRFAQGEDRNDPEILAGMKKHYGFSGDFSCRWI